MRLFYAALALEANTFLSIPTSYEAFAEKLYFPPGKYPEKQAHQTGAMDAVRAHAQRPRGGTRPGTLLRSGRDTVTVPTS